MAIYVISTAAPSAVAQIRWPVQITYTVTHLEFANDRSPSTEARYEFTGANWREWTNRPLAGRTSTCWQRRADGRLYQGESACDSMRAAPFGDSAAGGGPNPWLNGRRIEDYVAQGYEVVPLERGRAVAERLRVREDDLAELRISKGSTCLQLGYLECHADPDEPHAYVATVVVDRSTALALLNEEILGDLVLSRYEVDTFEAVPSYQRPAGH